MEKESFSGQMERNILDGILKIKNAGLEHLNGQMEDDMLDFGRMDLCMEKGFFLKAMAGK